MIRKLLGLLILTVFGCVFTPYANAEHALRSMSAQLIARKVALVYRESRPAIVHLQRTQTESTHEPMVFVELSGRFHRGHKVARFLYFSALVKRWYVWGIQAYDAQHRQLWFDPTLPRAK